jgi:beta-lactamase superfamily II metal-dependent hydrolase
MKAPKTGANIRMYRQGHGDCFLLAFPRVGGGRPVYMLIDCGYKPGSQISPGGKKVDATRIVKDIAASTGKKIDVVVITHEHQDHVNALGKFKDFDFGEAWFAWTEDPDDDLANELRKRHKDQLLGLLGARRELKLAAAGNAEAAEAVDRVDELLALELGNDDDDADDADEAILSGIDIPAVFGAASDPLRSKNKKAMSTIKKRAGNRLRFINPHEKVLTIDKAAGIRIFPLGPPRKADLLSDEDPKGTEGFPGHGAARSLSFFAAASGKAGDAPNNADGSSGGGSEPDVEMPFNPTFSLPTETALNPLQHFGFFSYNYGDMATGNPDEDFEAPADADWRRIDEEWLYSAETFALKLNRGVNNTSLVLAIELAKSGKVLLFAGDAQLGNWKSWDDGTFQSDGKTRTAKDLLGCTVLYKVGHHGSHNATLKGSVDDTYPNLGWMGRGKYASEFTAMITAHNKWALEKARWNHPLPSIKKELLKKTAGRLFQIDEDEPQKPETVTQSEWDDFRNGGRVKCTDLYFELTVLDS